MKLKMLERQKLQNWTYFWTEKCNWKAVDLRSRRNERNCKSHETEMLRTLEDYGIGYSDFHNLMGFSCKNMPNNILKNVCKKVFQLVFLRICILLGSKFVKKKFLGHLSTSLKLQSPHCIKSELYLAKWKWILRSGPKLKMLVKFHRSNGSFPNPLNCWWIRFGCTA